MRSNLKSAISGPFEQLARAIKGSPDQPRDDHGRWTSTGTGADHSKDAFSDSDHLFIKTYGDNFASALNHLSHEYGILGDGALELAGEIDPKTPEELVHFVEKNFVGSFDDETSADLAEEWLKDEGLLDTLPKEVRDNLDLDSVASDLTKKDGRLMEFYDADAEQYHAYKRPTKG